MSILSRLLSLAALALLASACASQTSDQAPGSSPSAGSAAPEQQPAASGSRNADRPSPLPAASAAAPGASALPALSSHAAANRGGEAYAGGELVVHEWGTNTVVVGSNGSLQRGLQHEGDDLPEFVFDRIKQGDLLGFPAVDKMETPVIYFYSEQPRTLSVRVNMPRGVLTQWYPAVAAFAPPIYNATVGFSDLVDPVSDLDYAYSSQRCQQKYTAPVIGGVLDWGNVQILARDVAPRLQAAPLDRFTWSYARQVAANAVRVGNPSSRTTPEVVSNAAQDERFLFYRGLGQFEPPLRATTVLDQDHDVVHLQELAEPIVGPVWLLNVDANGGVYVRVTRGKGGFQSAVPTLNGAPPMASFVQALADELTEALSSTGLYRDEALAMVNTWRTQWFSTPGVRVLYFAPDAWLERELPLTIAPAPAPAAIKRVMVMRMELLTTTQERADLNGMLQDLPAAREYFRSLGRFAEPRLRRAMELTAGRTPPQAQDLLRELAGPNAIDALDE
jgi:hypothetical protein